MEDRKLTELLSEILQQLKPVSELSNAVVMRAEIQEYTEDLYNQLSRLAYDGMDFLRELQVGDVITPEWAERRNDLVNRAERLVADAPNARRGR